MVALSVVSLLMRGFQKSRTIPAIMEEAERIS